MFTFGKEPVVNIKDNRRPRKKLFQVINTVGKKVFTLPKERHS